MSRPLRPLVVYVASEPTAGRTEAESVDVLAEGIRRARPAAEVRVLSDVRVPATADAALREALPTAGLLVLGAERIDAATGQGAWIVALARRAAERGLPVLAVTPERTVDPGALAGYGVTGVAADAELESAVAQTAPRRAPGSVLPVEPTPHFHFLRTPRLRWWRPLVGIVAMAAAFLLLSVVVSLPALFFDLGTGRTQPEDYLGGKITLTPALFLANNLSLAALIPAALLIQWAVYRQRPTWLSSVEGGFRWRWMGLTALVIVPIMVLFLVGDLLLEGGAAIGRLSPDAWILLAIVLLTTPLQSAGEEYAFRGFLLRSVAAWIPNRAAGFAVGAVVSSALFMLAHNAGDIWLNTFYFSLGLVLSVIAWRTGGLEAGVLIHAVNNTVIFVPTVLWGDISGTFDRQAGSASPIALIGLVVFAGIAVAVEFLARRRVRRLGPPALVPAPVRGLGRP